MLPLTLRKPGNTGPPIYECPTSPTPYFTHTPFIPSDLNLQLKSFPKLTSAGLSGVHTLLQQYHYPTVLKYLFAANTASAELSAVCFTEGKLTALNKPRLGGVHPIVINEALHQLTGKCLWNRI